MNKLKILLALHYDLDGNAGAAGSTLSLSKEYQKDNHSVSHYSTDNLPRKGISGTIRRALFPIFFCQHINSILSREDIDIIDASTGDIWLWKSLFKEKSKRRPLIVTRSHGLEHLEHLSRLEEARKNNLKLSWKYPLYYGGLFLWEVKKSFQYADLIFVLNSEEKEYIANNFAIEPHRIYITPNGIPDSFLNLPFTSFPHEEEKTIRIAQIGTYISRKGVQYAKFAINNTLKKFQNVEFTFLGTKCPECLTAEQIYADFEPELHHRIHVIPQYQHTDLPNLLRNHHIKLFPTISEGFGKALVEAMACGLAPITTATAGPLEIVQHEKNGIIIPVGDTDAIEASLASLISNRELLEILRSSAYARAQRFSWSQMAQIRINAYKDFLNKRKYS